MSGLDETVDNVVDSTGFSSEGAIVEVDLTVGDFVKAFVALEEAVRVEVDLTVDDSPSAVGVGCETGVVRCDFALLGVSIPVLAAAFDRQLAGIVVGGITGVVRSDDSAACDDVSLVVVIDNAILGEIDFTFFNIILAVVVAEDAGSIPVKTTADDSPPAVAVRSDAGVVPCNLVAVEGIPLSIGSLFDRQLVAVI